jgi:ethanolaminephosphotransferase
MPGLAQYEELGFSEKLGKDWQKPPTPPFDKVVFMVVDALRSDFVYGEESGMSFVQRYDSPLESLIQSRIMADIPLV